MVLTHYDFKQNGEKKQQKTKRKRRYMFNVGSSISLQMPLGQPASWQNMTITNCLISTEKVRIRKEANAGHEEEKQQHT